MNEAQINGIVRWALTGLVGFLAAKNVLPEAVGGMVVQYGVAIIGSLILAVWSVRSNSVPEMAAAVTKAQPDTVIVTDIATAAAVPSPNVVALKPQASVDDLKAITVDPSANRG